MSRLDVSPPSVEDERSQLDDEAGVRSESSKFRSSWSVDLQARAVVQGAIAMLEGLLLARREHALRNHLLVALTALELWKLDAESKTSSSASANSLQAIELSLRELERILPSGEGRVSMVQPDAWREGYDLVAILGRLERTLFQATPPLSRVAHGSLVLRGSPLRSLPDQGASTAASTAPLLPALAVVWIELGLVALTMSLAARFRAVEIEVSSIAFPKGPSAARLGDHERLRDEELGPQNSRQTGELGHEAADEHVEFAGGCGLDRVCETATRGALCVRAMLRGLERRKGSASARGPAAPQLDGYLVWLVRTDPLLRCEINRSADGSSVCLTLWIMSAHPDHGGR